MKLDRKIIILLIVGIFIIILIKNFINSKEKGSEYQIGEIIGYLTIDSLNITNLEVRDTINVENLKLGAGRYEIGDEQHYNGNICLFMNALENIANLRISDSIQYRCGEETRSYTVQTIELLPQSKEDSYLRTSHENKITLIMRVDNTTTDIIVQAIEINERKE